MANFDASPTRPHDEVQYLDLIRTVLETGDVRPDRTGTGTISIFAPPNFRFSLADSTLPLLTTKRTFLRGIVEELLWFVRGCTDAKELSAKGVKIWYGNSKSRAGLTIAARETLDLYTASSGGTLVPSTKTVTRTMRAKESTSLRSAFKRSRTIPQTAASS